MTSNHEILREAKLQDIAADSLHEQLENRLGRSCALYDASYGVNRDTGHLVLQFFPPGYVVDNSREWADWHDFRDRMEGALLRHFKDAIIDAGFTEELKSFYANVKHPGVIDLPAFLHRFFSDIEAGVDTVSGS